MSYKKAKVVMLPTNKKAEDVLLKNLREGTTKNQLYLSTKNYLYTQSYLKEHQWEANHLYITSDDQIKENDWCLYNTAHDSKKPSWELLQCGKIEREEMHPHSQGKLLLWCKKIIATTDSSIIIEKGNVEFKIGYTLPQPPQEFIEKWIKEYNKGQQITDVLVEYKSKFETIQKGLSSFPEDDISWWTNKPKINPKDNTITIKKVKDSWSREEVEKLCRDAYQTGYNTCYNHESNRGNDISENKWIRENL